MSSVVVSAYDRCFLFVQRDPLTGVSNLLHQESSCNTRYVELPLTLPVGVDNIVLECDLLDAQDGGVSFLHIVDMINYGTERMPDSFAKRRLRITKWLASHHDSACASSELRVLLPELYPAQDIQRLYEMVIPNSYGIAKGFRFVNDTMTKLKQYGCRRGTMVRTHIPDVYRVEGLPGNDIAYIGGAAVARDLISRFGCANRIELTFQWDAIRQKWAPKLVN